MSKLGRGCRLSKLIWYRGLLKGWCDMKTGSPTWILAAAVLAGNEDIMSVAKWYTVPVRSVAASIWFELDRMDARKHEKKLKRVRLAGLARIND